MVKYGNAVVVGKFLPFHVGHQALIQKAVNLARHVDVLLVANPNIDIYPPHVRALAIYETFHFADITVHIVDDLMTDDTTEESHFLWARYTKAILGYSPEAVVASEQYAVGWARHMGADFVMYDEERATDPVSGTLVREDAYKMRDYLPYATKRFVVPRIVIVGAESTGTTTLTKALAEHYNTAWVPELGRMMSEEAVDAGFGNDDMYWNDNKFWVVSRGQDAMEENLATQANGVLMCDTDSWATALWYEYYMRKESAVSGTQLFPLLAAGKRQAQKHALYIVTMDDIPFVQDERETRTGERLRTWHTNRFLSGVQELKSEYRIPYIQASGSLDERLAKAVGEIDEILKIKE